MTRAHHVTHGRTAERLDNIRKLITALQVRQLMREEIAELLQMGPSGVRKYLADLRGVIEVARYVDGTATQLGQPVYCLAITGGSARDYLASLSAQAPTSGRKGRISELTIAERDPNRHIHVMRYDAHFAVRVSRAIPAHPPMMLHLYGRAGGEARV
jgi:hypothetical protein